MSLTDAKIRQVKLRLKEFKLGDSGGLYLLVRPTGTKTWKLKIRTNGREQKITFASQAEALGSDDNMSAILCTVEA